MYACIDLGSNSFHLLIAERQDGKVQLIERCSEQVQLGKGIHRKGKISNSAFARGLDCLQRFQALIAQHEVERYWALGTNTFRTAKNAAEFIQAATNIGIEISTISGVQEAMLIYAGVNSILPASDENRLVIDIGGGSTELIVGADQQYLITQSLPIGCVSWRDQYFSSVANEPEALSLALDRATTAAAILFTDVAQDVIDRHCVSTYASSGTAKMLTSVCRENGLEIDGITDVALIQLRERMLDAIVTGKELAGLKDKRRDLLLPGYAVMKGLLQSLACEKILFSPTAMREGMLEFMARNPDVRQALAGGGLPKVTYA